MENLRFKITKRKGGILSKRETVIYTLKRNVNFGYASNIPTTISYEVTNDDNDEIYSGTIEQCHTYIRLQRESM